MSVGGNPACTTQWTNSQWPWQSKASAGLCACGGTVCKRSGRHCEHFTPCSAGAWHLGHTGSALKYSQAPLYITLLAEFTASHLAWGALPAIQGSSARQWPCPPEETGGGLFLPVWFSLGDFFLGFWFFPLVVCILICVQINLKVGELPSFSLLQSR